MKSQMINLLKKIRDLKIKISSNSNDINYSIELISIMIKVNGKIFKYKPEKFK